MFKYSENDEKLKKLFFERKMDNFDSERFEKRLLNLKNTQDAITGLSQWCLAKRTAHKQIVRSWLKILKEGMHEIFKQTLMFSI